MVSTEYFHFYLILLNFYLHPKMFVCIPIFTGKDTEGHRN